MNTVTTIRTLNVSVSGKGKAAREVAFLSIAPYAFVAEQSRGELIKTLGVALGSAPTQGQRDCAKREYVIGLAASRMPAGEFPKDCKEAADKLEFVRDLVTHYAAPAKEGAKAKALRKGQKGRRSAVQDRIIRNAEKSWSLIAAELSIGSAQTQATKNAKQGKAKRAPQMAGSTAKGKSAAPSHAELVKPVKDMTREDACAYVMTQASALLGFSNKSKVLPVAYGLAISAFKGAINKAANEEAEARAAADAKQAEKLR